MIVTGQPFAKVDHRRANKETTVMWFFCWQVLLLLICMKKWGLIIIVFCLLTVVMAQMFMAGLRFEKLEYKRVIDGDTFVVNNLRDGQEWRVRLWGIDSPDEKKCYYKEAKIILEQELTGEKITYERYGYDDYGRILAKVFVNGKNLEEVMVATGAAIAYDASEVHDKLKPSAEYVAALREIEETAKKAKLGVWSSACARI